MKIIAKIVVVMWAGICLIFAIAAATDKYWIATLFFLAAAGIVLPQAASRIRRRTRLIAGAGLLLSGFIAIGIYAPPSPEMIAARREAIAKERARTKAQKEAAKRDEAAKLAQAEKAARSGLQCLSDWDGSNDSFVELVTARLRDPESFKHYETRIAPRNEKGVNPIVMEYGARNGFGGMNRTVALGFVNPADCKATIITTGD